MAQNNQPMRFSGRRVQFVATMMPDDEKVSKPLPAWDDLEEAA
jgi:hypothetical protein